MRVISLYIPKIIMKINILLVFLCFLSIKKNIYLQFYTFIKNKMSIFKPTKLTYAFLNK